jgi:hypothetical protein
MPSFFKLLKGLNGGILESRLGLAGEQSKISVLLEDREKTKVPRTRRGTIPDTLEYFNPLR